MNDINDLEKRIAYLEGVITHLVRSDRYIFQKHLQLMDGRNIQLATSTGTKLGTATGQKLAFWGQTPVIQPTRPTDAASIILKGTSIGIWS